MKKAKGQAQKDLTPATHTMNSTNQGLQTQAARLAAIRRNGSKKLCAYLSLLVTPEGISEAQMQDQGAERNGRNVVSKLWVHHGLVIDRDRKKAQNGDHYTLYRMADQHNARQLAQLLILECKHEGLEAPNPGYLEQFVKRFPAGGMEGAA